MTPDQRPPTEHLSDPRQLQREIADLNSNMGLESTPFGSVRERVLSGNIEGLDEKQVLYFHYSIFIRDVWNRVNSWRETQKASGDNPIGLVEPVPELRILKDPEALVRGDSRLPLLKNLPQLMTPLSDEYIRELRDAPEEQKRYGTRILIELLFRIHLYDWEKQHKLKTLQTHTPHGVDLFEQCNKVLIEEMRRTTDRLLAQSGVAPMKRAQASQGMEQIYGAGFALTNIIGEAFGVGLKAWDLIPKEDRGLIPLIASTHQNIAPRLFSLYLSERQLSPKTSTIEEVFKVTVQRFLGSDREAALESMRKEKAAGNSSANPFVVSCPALATPAFMGCARVLDEVMSFIDDFSSDSAAPSHLRSPGMENQ